jgi:hypothetical protein
MKNILLTSIFFCGLCFFIGCFNQKAAVSDYLISYELPKNGLIEEVLTFVKPAVDQIINQELEKIITSENKDRLHDQIGFYCKDQYRLTLAYVNQYQDKSFDQLSDLVENLALEHRQGTAYFDAHVDFFGKDQNAFIIKIADKHDYLSSLNQTIRNRLHQIHKDFFGSKNAHLYSIEKSEAFDYKPHVHVATLYIRSKAGDQDRALLEPVLKTIFQRVRDELFPQVSEIIKKSKQRVIDINSLSLVNLTQRAVVVGKKQILIEKITCPLKSE